MNAVKENDVDLIDLLYEEILQLQTEHQKLLEQEFLSKDVQKLKSKIDECRNQSATALSYLKEHGKTVLEDIKCRLKAAVADEARLIEESPSVAENSLGETAHEAHKATAIACDASDKIETALVEFEKK